MNMQILKKWWFWIIVVVVLIAFFFPKPSGSGGRLGVQPLPQTWTDRECSCLGFESSSSAPDAGYNSLCFGIPFSCSCTKNTIRTPETGIEKTDC